MLPVFLLPFLIGGFYSLGGGRGNAPKGGIAGRDTGFNLNLPVPKNLLQRQITGKTGAYQQNDRDSARWRSFRQLDTNLNRLLADSGGGMVRTGRLWSVHSHAALPVATEGIHEDPRAQQLLQQLDQLKASLQRPTARSVASSPVFSRPEKARRESEDGEAADPQLATLDGMLDKILRIQHGEPERAATRVAESATQVADTLAGNSLPAVVAMDQIVVAGSTIALRTEAEARIGSVVIPRDQLIYGVVSINNDRMMVQVTSIRKGQAIYAVGLQLYDMDALPGIHIPGDLGRETAKQSTEQALGGVNLLNADPGLGAQATNAGIQAARLLLSRKVRTVRISIRAGYQVLLRNTRASGGLRVMGLSPGPDSAVSAPVCMGCEPFMDKQERSDRLRLGLRGIYLQGGYLFFDWRLTNDGPIEFMPQQIRWSVQDRRRVKRTAQQDQEIPVLSQKEGGSIAGDSSRDIMTVFRPFALARDKQLLLHVSEANGARFIEMVIHPKELLHCKQY